MRTLERGLSDFNVGHRLVVNYFYAPSLGGGQRWWNSGLLAHVFGGWRLGGILSFRTGIPFSPRVSVRTPGYLFSATRPNLLPAAATIPFRGAPNNTSTPPCIAFPRRALSGMSGATPSLRRVCSIWISPSRRNSLWILSGGFNFEQNFSICRTIPISIGIRELPLSSSGAHLAVSILLQGELNLQPLLPGKFSLRCDFRSN